MPAPRVPWPTSTSEAKAEPARAVQPASSAYRDYIVIGWIALEVAFRRTDQAADRSGALHELGGTPIGAVALWVLVVGFSGTALWRLSEVVYGTPGTGRPNARTRLVAFVNAVFYALIAWSVLKYALGQGSPPSTDQQSVDLTATLMRHPGGRVAVIAALLRGPLAPVRAFII